MSYVWFGLSALYLAIKSLTAIFASLRGSASLSNVRSLFCSISELDDAQRRPGKVPPDIIVVGVVVLMLFDRWCGMGVRDGDIMPIRC